MKNRISAAPAGAHTAYGPCFSARSMPGAVYETGGSVVLSEFYDGAEEQPPAVNEVLTEAPDLTPGPASEPTSDPGSGSGAKGLTWKKAGRFAQYLGTGRR